MGQRSFWQQCRDGQQYMKTWPMRKELALLFPEQRYIKATRFAIKVMPAVAVLCVFSQMVVAQYGYGSLAQGIVMAVFALGLPLQGLWWLGKRSRTMLPPSLASWYREVYDKVSAEGYAQQPIKSQPRYVELATVLNRAFQKLDDTALSRWF